MSCKRFGFVRFAAASCAALLLFMSPAGLSAVEVKAEDSLDSLYEQQKELDEKIDQLEQDIADQKASLAEQQQYVSDLKKKIQNTTQIIDRYDSQVRGLNASVETLNASIAEKEEAIAQKEEEISAQYEELRQRLRAISKTGNLSMLQMLLDTGSYTDYLIKSKMMETVAENDQRLMDETEAAIQEIDAEKASLNEEKAEAAEQLEQAQELKKQADSEKASLDVLYGKANKAAQTIEGQISDSESDLEDAKDEEEQLEERIQEIINSSQSTGEYGGGTMAWPVPTVRAISSVYGMRWGKLHRGIDIANGPIPVYGENIVAADDGVVIYANSSDWWGGGYGYHVIIDHGLDANGNKISTLYAHCSYVGVSVGQTVKRGETVIGRAGNSGNVTGPLLHFEVRVNGVAVDPIKNGYISL